MDDTGQSKSPSYELGSHAAQLAALQRGQNLMQEDISEIKSLLAEHRGERRASQFVLHAVSAMIGAGAAIATILKLK